MFKSQKLIPRKQSLQGIKSGSDKVRKNGPGL